MRAATARGISLHSPQAWASFLAQPAGRRLRAGLPDYLRSRRWFGGKARTIKSTDIIDAIALPDTPHASCLALVRVDYGEGAAETYLLALALAGNAGAGQMAAQPPDAVIARVGRAGNASEVVVYDALADRGHDHALLDAMRRNRTLPGWRGELTLRSTDAFERLLGQRGTSLPSALLGREQSNTSIAYGERLILKLFRRLSTGINPDVEIGRFLTERGFAHVPPVAGFAEYHPRRGASMVAAILQGYVHNQGDAWKHSLSLLDAYFPGVGEAAPLPAHSEGSTERLLDLITGDPPADARPRLAPTLAMAALLGRRTAELHLALASDDADPDFAPEPLSAARRRAAAHALMGDAARIFALVKAHAARAEVAAPRLRQVLVREAEILRRLAVLADRPIGGQAIRCHGDYHLGQVLHTGTDFVIIDFEGEPARPLAARRRKQPALKDVAGMLRSLHYAASAGLRNHLDARPVHRSARALAVEGWARLWHLWTSVTFLKAYLGTAGQGEFLPGAKEDIAILLDAYMLDKAVYELGYELNNRPAWLPIPIQGILQLVPGAGRRTA